MDTVTSLADTMSDVDSVSTVEQQQVTATPLHVVPESPFHQKQLHLLANAFKGSVNHSISTSGRKPSMMKLTKRTDSSDPSMLGVPSPHVKFAAGFADVDKERSGSSAHKGILKRSEYAEQITSAKPFAAHPVMTHKAADEHTDQIVALTREQQLEIQRTELMKSIQFHHHTEQSVSQMDVKVLAELQWLDAFPQSQRWMEIQNKIAASQSQEGCETIRYENDLADRFIDTALLQGAAHINNLLSGADNDKERLVVRLTFALLNDVVGEVIQDTCADLVKQSTQAWAVLNKSLVKSLASVSLGLEGSSSRFWKMSGREQILKGALLDAQRTENTDGNHSINNTSSNITGEHALHTSHPIISLSTQTAAVSTAKTAPNSVNVNGSSGMGADNKNTNGSSNSNSADNKTPYSPLYHSTVHIPRTIPSIPGDDDGAEQHVPHSVDTDDLDLTVEEEHHFSHSSTKVPGLTSHQPSNSAHSNAHDNAHSGHTGGRKGAHLRQADVTELMYDIEVAHWAGISCTMVINAPLQIPSTLSATTTGNSFFSRSNNTSLGVVSTVKLLTQPSTHYGSLLICGLSNGRVVSYGVRWTGVECALIGASALPEKAQQSPIVDVKSSSLGSNVFLSRAQNGVICVHQVNSALSADIETALAPINRKSTSWFPFFGSKQRKSELQNIGTLFRIDSSDLIFALPSLHDTIKASISDTNDTDGANNITDSGVNTVVANNKTSTSIFSIRSKITDSADNNGAFPSAVCFHPNLTLLGTNTSIVVGTLSGDVVKFNMDYLHEAVAAPVAYPSVPFVNKEFIHPHNAPKGFVLTSGVNEKLGNKVFREVFHYHKAKILLLEVVNRVSPFIVSVDQSGLVALWKYDAQHFEGKCWFRPYKTSKLALQCTELIPSGQFLPASCDDTAPLDSAREEGEPDITLAAPPTSTTVAPQVSAVPGTWAGLKDHQHGPGHRVKNHDPTTDEEIKTQLKVLEVFNNKHTRRVVKSYFPVYSESRELWLQYRSVEYQVPLDFHPEESPVNRLRVKKKAVTPKAAKTPSSSTVASVTSNTGAAAAVVTTDSAAALPSSGGSADSTAAVPTVSPLGAKSELDDGSKVDVLEHPTAENAETREDLHGSTNAPSVTADAPPNVDTNAEQPAVMVSIASAASRSDDGAGEAGDVEQVQLADEDDLLGPPAPSITVPPLVFPGQPAVATPVILSAPGGSALSAGPVTPPSLRSVRSGAGSRKESADQPNSALEMEGADAPTVLTMTPTRHGNAGAGNSTVPADEEIPVTVFTRLMELLCYHKAGMLGSFVFADDRAAVKATASAATPPLSTEVPPLTTSGDAEQSAPAVEPSSLVQITAGPASSMFFSASQESLQLGAISVTSDSTVPPVPMRDVTEWSAAEIMVEKELNFTIMSTKMTFDGTEVVMLLAARILSDKGNSADKGDLSSKTTVYYIVPYLPIEQRFHQPYPKLFLSTDKDAVLDFCVGPIQFETLTRTAFVLTKQSLRLFSMHTGREIITNTFPFVWELGSFVPNLVTVCPSQRVVTLAATDDARIAVYLLQHAQDGSTHTTTQQEERALLKRRKLSSKVRAQAGKDDATHGHEAAVRTVLNIVVESSPEHHAKEVDVKDIMEAIMAHVMKNIDLRTERDRKAGLIAEVYEGKMGFIEPMVWPPLVTDMLPLKLSLDEAEQNEPDSPPGRARKAKGRKKHRKVRIEVHAEPAEVAMGTETTAESVGAVVDEQQSQVQVDAAARP